jgi:hypothetical protein
MTSQIRIPIIDHGAEKSTVSVWCADNVLDGAITAFVGAIDGVSIGTLDTAVLALTVDKDAGSQAPPASKLAQREIKWLARYTDNVLGTSYRFEIPCADLNLLGSSDMLDLTAGAGLALKNAFESAAKSKFGNAVTLQSVEFVGRNS